MFYKCPTFLSLGVMCKEKMISECFTSEIKRRFPETVFTENSDENNLVLEFQTRWQPEFIYAVWLGQQQIQTSVGAKLLGTTLNQYFWYQPFVPYGSDTNEDKLNDCVNFIFAELDILTNYDTRIIQRKGWFNQTFICEYFKENKWHKHYKHAALRTNFDFPKIIGRERIYK